MLASPSSLVLLFSLSAPPAATAPAPESTGAVDAVADAEEADPKAEPEAEPEAEAESDPEAEARAVAEAQRQDWREGLNQGFAWDFKHGSSVRIGALFTGQGVMRIDEIDGAEAGFVLRHARTSLAASFFDGRLEATVQPEFANGPRLLDLEVAARFDHNFGVRLGFYRPFFMRDFRVNVPLFALPTRGFAHDHFSTGRRLGVAVEGQPLDGHFEYSAGVYNGRKYGAGGVLPNAGNAMFMARVAVNPLGAVPYTQTPQEPGRGPALGSAKLSIGLNVATERAPLTAIADASAEGEPKSLFAQQTTFAADVTLLHPKGWLSATGIRRWHRGAHGTSEGPATRAVGSSGGYLMGGVPLGSSIFDLTARTGIIDDNEGPARGQHEAAVNAFVAGNNLRVTVAYLCERERGFGAGCQTHSFTTQARLLF